MSAAVGSPTPMDDLTASFVKIGAVVAARKLDVFGKLAAGPKSATDLARAVEADPTGVRLLAEQLVAVGYLEKVDDSYGNGPIARAWLNPGNEIEFNDYLSWLGVSGLLWAELDEIVRRGGPVTTIWRQMQVDHPEWGQALGRYHRASARLIADAIVEAIALPVHVRRLLDLGGGHGAHSVAFCRRYPGLAAVIYDLPFLGPVVDETARSASLSDRISFQAGDYLAESVGADFDLVLCANIFHNHAETEVRVLCTKIGDALRPGGLLLCYELDRAVMPPAPLAMVDLVFFMEGRGRTYGFQELQAWLAEAGLGRFRTVPVPSIAGRTLLTARKSD